MIAIYYDIIFTNNYTDTMIFTRVCMNAYCVNMNIIKTTAIFTKQFSILEYLKIGFYRTKAYSYPS